MASVDQRASSHSGYNHDQGVSNWASDADVGLLNAVVEAVGARPHNGWGSETGVLLVSGGSHAGNAAGDQSGDRRTPGRQVHLIPLEEVVASSGARFAISAPWRKHVWRDPEAEDTN